MPSSNGADLPVGAPPIERANPLLFIRVEKAAADSGFELPVTWSGSTATLRSVQFPEAVTVECLATERFGLAASNYLVLPNGVPLEVTGWAGLYEALAKVSAAARTLPDRVAQQFIKAAASLPQATEAERWVVKRVGQDLFRKALLDYWLGRCCVTGLSVAGLLRASHIKPWAACASDEERLDVFNGLLLAPNLDALFDGGWISFADNGDLLVASELSDGAREALGLSTRWRVSGLMPPHCAYLAYHREHVWRGTSD